MSTYFKTKAFFHNSHQIFFFLASSVLLTLISFLAFLIAILLFSKIFILPGNRLASLVYFAIITVISGLNWSLRSHVSLVLFIIMTSHVTILAFGFSRIKRPNSSKSRSAILFTVTNTDTSSFLVEISIGFGIPLDSSCDDT